MRLFYKPDHCWYCQGTRYRYVWRKNKSRRQAKNKTGKWRTHRVDPVEQWALVPCKHEITSDVSVWRDIVAQKIRPVAMGVMGDPHKNETLSRKSV